MMFRKRRSNDIRSNRNTIQSTNINNNNHNNIVSGGNNNKIRRTRNSWTRAHLYNYVQYRSNSSSLVLVVAVLLFVIALIRGLFLIGNLAWNDNSVSYEYFNNRTELKDAVDEYLNTSCATNKSKCDVIVKKYGWPMNNWC